MKQVVIGFDTSCYTTSVAAVTADGKVIASCRKLLPVAAGERGLRQSEAVFAHTRQLPPLVEELANKLGKDHSIAAVCVSSRPRDDDSSYMPVFQVGEGMGRSIAALNGVPCYCTTHQRGHVAAAKVESGIRNGDLLAVHLSGGTTELLSLQNDTLTLLGGTLDLHAGQMVDRAGVAMGLPFPSGPYLEQLAVKGRSENRLPVSFEHGDDLHCHLSGAESQVSRWLKADALPKEDIAAEVYDFLARTIARMIIAGAKETGIRQVLIAGGVSSSALLRKLLTERIHKKDAKLHVCFGRPEYSGDNAVGTALIGAALYCKQEAAHGSTDP